MKKHRQNVMEDVLTLKTRAFSVIKRRERNGRSWHYVKKNPGVAVFAITNKNEVVLVRQRRPIINKILLEIPAGGTRSKKSLTREARRELLEETGFDARNISPLGYIYPSPGYYTEITHIFLAKDLIHKGQMLTRMEKTNQLTVVLRPLSLVLGDITAGRITDAKTIVAALIYFKKRGEGHRLR